MAQIVPLELILFLGITIVGGLLYLMLSSYGADRIMTGTTTIFLTRSRASLKKIARGGQKDSGGSAGRNPHPVVIDSAFKASPRSLSGIIISGNA
jgi:hypothetical protein